MLKVRLGMDPTIKGTEGTDLSIKVRVERDQVWKSRKGLEYEGTE